MEWRKLIAVAWMSWNGWAVGCAAEPVLARDADLARAIAATGDYASAGARGQKPETRAATTPAQPQQPITLIGLTPEGSEPSALPSARIWATVNGEAILAEEVRSAAHQALKSVNSLPEPQRSQQIGEILKVALGQIVDREVVLQDAISKLTRNGTTTKFFDKLKEAAAKEFEKTWVRGIKDSYKLKSDEDFKRFLRENGMSYEAAKRQWERQFMSMEYLRSRVFPTIDRETGHEQIEEYYEKHPEEFQISDMVDWQDLFVANGRHGGPEKARQVAESIVQQLRQGVAFEKLSEQFDDGDSRLRQGAGIGRKRGEIKPAEAEQHLFNMKDGEVGPILSQSTGYHVIRLVKRTQAGMVPFDEKTQKQIRDKLRNDIASREMKKMVLDLKRKAVIEYAR